MWDLRLRYIRASVKRTLNTIANPTRAPAAIQYHLASVKISNIFNTARPSVVEPSEDCIYTRRVQLKTWSQVIKSLTEKVYGIYLPFCPSILVQAIHSQQGHCRNMTEVKPSNPMTTKLECHLLKIKNHYFSLWDHSLNDSYASFNIQTLSLTFRNSKTSQ